MHKLITILIVVLTILLAAGWSTFVLGAAMSEDAPTDASQRRYLILLIAGWVVAAILIAARIF